MLVVASDVLVPDRHGGSTHVHELVTALRRHGPTLLLAREGSLGEDVAAIGRPLRRFPAALRVADAATRFPRALAVVREFAPDAIYERCTSYGLGALLSAALRIPLLTMVLDQRYSWLSLLRARRLIATREDIVPASVRHKVVKVAWGANPEVFRADLSGDETRRRYALEGRYVVAYSGSFKDWHGVDILVGVARRLRDLPISFLLVGDGPRRADMELAVRRAELEGRFVFTGAVDYAEVPRLLAAADVCVAPFDPERHGPSRRRGFVLDPLKVFEYMALGKPTITIRAANLLGMFDDGVHLVMVPPVDVEALAQAIARMAADPLRASSIAEHGRARVLERHTWAAHAEQLVGLFREMLAEQRAA